MNNECAIGCTKDDYKECVNIKMYGELDCPWESGTVARPCVFTQNKEVCENNGISK